MDEQGFAVMAAHYEAGDRVDHAGADGCLECFNYGGALVDEVRRLREWVRFAAQNMTYPDAQAQLAQALTGDGRPDWD